MINWTIINTDNLPEEKVLAANFKPYSYGYTEKIIGHVYIEHGKIFCENEYELLEGVTHYVLIDKFDLKINELKERKPTTED